MFFYESISTFKCLIESDFQAWLRSIQICFFYLSELNGDWLTVVFLVNYRREGFLWFFARNHCRKRTTENSRSSGFASVRDLSDFDWKFVSLNWFAILFPLPCSICTFLEIIHPTLTENETKDGWFHFGSWKRKAKQKNSKSPKSKTRQKTGKKAVRIQSIQSHNHFDTLIIETR